jgi:hypothetical protein
MPVPQREGSLFAAILIMETWNKFQEFINIKSGAAIGLFTFQIMGMAWIVLFKVHGIVEIPQSVLTAYGIVVTGVTINGISKVVKGS